MSERMVILADDLTGACDAAAPFATRGVPTVVVLRSMGETTPDFDDAAVRAIDADTRRLSPRLAAARTAAAAGFERAGGARSLYKKIDSTLRGHVAAELHACLRAWGSSMALLCPAFPAAGRWVQGGRLYVDGRDDVGAVAELAGFGPRARLAGLGLDVLARGARNVALVLTGHRRAGIEVVVADANAPAHLAVLAEAAAGLDPAPLLVGSAGLARALAERAGSGQRAADESTPPLPTAHCPLPTAHARPWLVVAGSQTEVTGMQVAELERAGAVVVPLEADAPSAARLAETVGERTARVLAEGRTPVLRLVVSAEAGASAHGRRAEQRAARALGRTCRAAVERAEPAGLFLTGGLTARACLLALGVRALGLESEPLPGIAVSRGIGGAWDGRPVITKAGGFGAPDAVRRLVLPDRPPPPAGEGARRGR